MQGSSVHCRSPVRNWDLILSMTGSHWRAEGCWNPMCVFNRPLRGEKGNSGAWLEMERPLKIFPGSKNTAVLSP